MKSAIIIPARYHSTRFPGKPLAIIAGKSMIQWVWEAAMKAELVQDVLVATDDSRIAEVARSFGAHVFITSGDHATGTDRVAEAALSLDHEVIVNLQGDEPLTNSDHLDTLIKALLENRSLHMTTLATQATAEEVTDPNCVKVVKTVDNRALYFSRAGLPFKRNSAHSSPLKHIGIYAFRADFLQTFSALAQTPNEQTESLEQLRALEYGYSIGVVTIDNYQAASVDTPGDIVRAQELLLGKV